MPEFEIYPSNLRRHKTNKQTKVTEQNSPMFALKLDFLAFASIKKRSERFHCVLQVTWTNSHLVLVEK